MIMDAPRIFTPESYTRLRKMECDSWWNPWMRDVAALILELAVPSLACAEKVIP